MKSIPPECLPYSRSPTFTETTLPESLRRDHSTKAGTWALIHVLEGRLTYRIDDPRRPASETVLMPDTRPGVVEPTIFHAVKPLGPVRFYVEFHRREGAL